MPEVEEEIDLMDYVKVIIKRKGMIFIIFLASVIVTGIFSFLMPKIYKIDTLLEIGEIAGEMVDVPGEVVEKVKGDVYGVLVREKLQIPEEKYPKIKVENLKDTRLVKLAIESSETEKAKNILEELNSLILAQHQEKTERKKEFIENEIKIAEEKIRLREDDIEKVKNKVKLVDSDIEKTKNKIKPLENDIERIKNKVECVEEEKENLGVKIEALEKVLVYEQTPGTQFALFSAKEKLASKKQEIENLYLSINSLRRIIEDYNLEINSLEKKKEDYNFEINSLRGDIENLNLQINSLRTSLDNIKPTKIVKSPTVSQEPVAPKKKLNIAVAGVLGLFLGVFLAFGKEWWERVKTEI